MQEILKVIEDTINKSSIKDFKSYLEGLKGQSKWLICSDYCIEDNNKANDIATFSVLPYYDYFHDIQNSILKKAPTDIKKTKIIRDSFVEYHRSGYIFHFSFIFGRKREHVLKESTKEDFVPAIKQTIDMLEAWEKNTPSQENYYQTSINKLKSLIQKMKANNFNLKLLKKILVVNLLASYIAYLLCREKNIEIVGWFSDRDDITIAYQGIALDLFHMNHHGLCERDSIEDSNTKLVIAMPSSASDEKLWFDELNKLPDYISGTLADYDFKKNYVSKDKFSKMLENCISENTKISILKLYLKSGMLRCSRILVERA